MLKKFFILSLFAFISLIIFLITLYANIRFEVNKIINYNPPLTTQFFDRNGKLLANYFDKEHRLYVKYNDIPPRVIEALVAIEDTAFFEHNGVNFNAIFRAIIKDIRHLKLVEGASTLTQQLVKTMLLSRKKSFLRKIKEVMLSLRLESVLSKEEILERYLNEVYFGRGYYGIKAASFGYFKKDLWELNLKEIAMLVGLPRAPSFYDPTRHLKHSLSRANQVINRMYKLGWINESQKIEAINFIPTIYKQSRTQNIAPYAVDTAIKELQKQIPDLKTGGYKINLTIDYTAQQIAKEALNYGYNKIIKRDKKIHNSNKSKVKTLNGAIVVLENKSGKILALVGGVDYKKSPFNRVIQSFRQPGSAVKPFIYQIALNLGYSTISPLVDISKTFAYKYKSKLKKWSPSNYERDFKGLIPLNEALIHSRNLATINLVTEVGIDIVYRNLIKFGFDRTIPYDLSITLGSFSISPIKLAELYSIFSNYGIKVKPYIIDSIVNKNGEIINYEPTKKYILSKEQAYLMTSILKDVVNRGTGVRAKINGLEIAGKTGTTNKNIDAWFCGYTPQYEAIVWFGNDDNKPMNWFETGGRSAAPVFRYFFRHYLTFHPEMKRVFEVPNGVEVYYYDNYKVYTTKTSPLPSFKDSQFNSNKNIEIF